MKRIKMHKKDLNVIYETLARRCRTIGPKVINGTVVMAENSYEDFPSGCCDRQGPGSYRIEKGAKETLFSFSPGTDSFKKYLCPSVATSFSSRRSAGTLVHWYEFERGYVTAATIIPPTSRNLMQMEANISAFVVQHGGKPSDYIRKETEKIVWGYDPCISCSTHAVIIDAR